MCGSASLAVKNAEQRSDAAAPAKTKLFKNNRSFGTYFGEQNDNQFLILQFIEFVLHMIYFISLKRYN